VEFTAKFFDAFVVRDDAADIGRDIGDYGEGGGIVERGGFAAWCSWETNAGFFQEGLE
jgi:hypothetical protein